MLPLPLTLLLCIPALYVTVASFSLVSGLKVYKRRENLQLGYMGTLVFGVSHLVASRKIVHTLTCLPSWAPCPLTVPSVDM